MLINSHLLYTNICSCSPTCSEWAEDCSDSGRSKSTGVNVQLDFKQQLHFKPQSGPCGFSFTVTISLIYRDESTFHYMSRLIVHMI